MRHHLILRVIAKLLLPAILLFALYVQFHGDFGPGGGFQAGVIFAAGLILYGLVFGLDAAQRLINPGLLRTLVGVGLLIYVGVGVVDLLLGGNYLEYDVLGEQPAGGNFLGIFLVELGVGITVASVMLTIFYAFAGRERK
jgi:multicomponent Na+:H+ antiporter subunit B